MNSFDLWDTLVASRDIRIAAGNQADGQSFPIAENLAKVQPDDLIVSDYEHAHRAVVIVRDVAGLDNMVTCTPDGKWKGTVWGSLLRKPKTHTGDNFRADVESPTQNGITGIQCTQYRMTEAEHKLIDLGFFNLAMCCREARLTTWSEKHRGIQLCQTNYNFPALFMASVLLNRKYPTGNLLFSARDCFMWVRLMRRLFDRGDYWYTSCHARLNADDNYDQYTQSFNLDGGGIVLVDLSGSGNSFSKLAERNPVLYGKNMLMYKPLRANATNNVPALFQSKDVWRLEQCNRAPHAKCMGVDGAGQPIWLDRQCTSPITDAIIDTQVIAFNVAVETMRHYDLTADLNKPDAVYMMGLDYLLHRLVNFAADVEPLRQLDIAEDAI
jgi:hypothetical protein